MAIKKLTKKQAAQQWDAVIKAVKASTPVNPHETADEQVARKKRLEAPGNHEEWFKYYFPKSAYAESTGFHKAASSRVIDNPEWYEVRMWSRELAKSTRTMLEVFYLMFVGHHTAGGNHHKKKNLILTSCNEKNAVKLLKPYRAHLEANQRIIQDYGEQKGLGQWEKDEFVTKDDKAFLAVGLGGQPRGTKHDDVRPDILLFDDVDTDQDCRNPTMVNNIWAWVDEAVIGTRSISQPTTIIWCGNRIANDCCVVRASKFANKTDIVNIRENGKSSWPGKNTEDMIDRVLAQRSYAAQQKEYFNNPIVEGSVFSKMNYKKALPISQYSHLVCYTDPSFKDTAKNDYKATVLVGKHKDEYHVIKAFVEQTTTANMIGWHYQVMDIVGQRSCYYYMEEVFLQELIINEFYNTSKLNGRTIPIMGDKRAKDAKFVRIESLLEPLHRNAKLYLNKDEEENPGMKRLDEQFLAFAPGSRAHDDGPDAVEGAVWMLMRKGNTFTADDVFMNSKRNSNKRY